MDDVLLDAFGPRSDRVQGFMDNTEVFRAMVDALGIGRTQADLAAGTAGARK